MAKLIDYNLEARKKLKAGVDRLAQAVIITLGPRGRNVVFEKNDGSPQMSCDGVTVAQQIELDDPVEEMGVKIIRDVAIRTSEGQIWFYLPRPFEDISGLAPSFYAQLQCYNRSYDYHVTIQGEATIVPEAEIHSQHSPCAGGDNHPTLCLRFKIENAVYDSFVRPTTTGLCSKFRRLLSWLFSENIVEKTLALQF